MSHGPGRHPYPPHMAHMYQQQQQQPPPQVADLNFGLKNLGLGPQQHHHRSPQNNMMLHNVFHATDGNRAAASAGVQVQSATDFLAAMGMGTMFSSPPSSSTMASAIQPPLQYSPVRAAPVPQQQQQQPSGLSVAASEFVPGFRKPEKKIVLYNSVNFKKKSRADDEMAINDVKKRLLHLYTSPQDVESVLDAAIDTIKSWTTSIYTYHQIVEDVFEFSVDEDNYPNFHSIGSKIVNYLTLKIPPYGQPPTTFFDTVIHKCCREFDNCMRLDQNNPRSQMRIKNVALMIAELFHTIKEGEMRVFLFAEQVASLCLLLVQIKTIAAFETVAKIFLVCGKDLKCLVDDMRFNCIMQHLKASTHYEMDSKTISMIQSVLQLNEGGWLLGETTPSRTSTTKAWSSGDDCQPVANPVDWDEYATDDYDEEWLATMLKFEEEDDFSDVEEDFNRFMLEAAQKYNH